MLQGHRFAGIPNDFLEPIARDSELRLSLVFANITKDRSAFGWRHARLAGAGSRRSWKPLLEWRLMKRLSRSNGVVAGATAPAPAVWFKNWSRVAVAVALKMGRRAGIDPSTRIAMNALFVPDREPTAARLPRVKP